MTTVRTVLGDNAAKLPFFAGGLSNCSLLMRVARARLGLKVLEVASMASKGRMEDTYPLSLSGNSCAMLLALGIPTAMLFVSN